MKIRLTLLRAALQASRREPQRRAVVIATQFGGWLRTAP